jgi:hypothetical protein
MSTQTFVTPAMRGILVDWLIEVHLRFELLPETLFLTTLVIDRYLSVSPPFISLDEPSAALPCDVVLVLPKNCRVPVEFGRELVRLCHFV